MKRQRGQRGIAARVPPRMISLRDPPSLLDEILLPDDAVIDVDDAPAPFRRSRTRARSRSCRRSSTSAIANPRSSVLHLQISIAFVSSSAAVADDDERRNGRRGAP